MAYELHITPPAGKRGTWRAILMGPHLRPSEDDFGQMHVHTSEDADSLDTVFSEAKREIQRHEALVAEHHEQAEAEVRQAAAMIAQEGWTGAARDLLARGLSKLHGGVSPRYLLYTDEEAQEARPPRAQGLPSVADQGDQNA
jgi:hypothetical protein